MTGKSKVSANPLMMDQGPRVAGQKPSLLAITIKDKSALYHAYMPFVKNGGLFIPTGTRYQLGDEVFMTVLAGALAGDTPTQTM